jgi:hypothetical protein
MFQEEEMDCLMCSFEKMISTVCDFCSEGICDDCDKSHWVNNTCEGCQHWVLLELEKGKCQETGCHFCGETRFIFRESMCSSCGVGACDSCYEIDFYPEENGSENAYRCENCHEEFLSDLVDPVEIDFLIDFTVPDLAIIALTA